MKKIIIVILFVNLFGCKEFKADGVLNSTQLVDVLEESILISGITSNKIFLYQEYDNSENRDSLIAFYQYGSNIWGYEISDSIIDNIEKRQNNHLPDSINVYSVLDVNLISNTNNFDGDYILISEPFFIDERKILFSLSRKNNNTSLDERWIYFLEKKEKSYRMISFYDFQNDKIYFQKDF